MRNIAKALRIDDDLTQLLNECDQSILSTTHSTSSTPFSSCSSTSNYMDNIYMGVNDSVGYNNFVRPTNYCPKHGCG